MFNLTDKKERLENTFFKTKDEMEVLQRRVNELMENLLILRGRIIELDELIKEEKSE